MKLSVVVPIFNEEQSLKLFHERLVNTLSGICNIDYEIIYVLDSPTDRSIEIATELIDFDKKTIGIILSKRFGHQASIMAGLVHSIESNCIVMMDGDLQHPPELINDMLNEFNKGFDIVNTIREETSEIFFLKKFFTNFYYKLIKILSDYPVIGNTPDFRMISSRVAQLIISNLNGKDIYLRGEISNIGFRQTTITFNALKRIAGNSKFGLSQLIKLSISGYLTTGKKPLYLISTLGMIFSMISLVMILILLVNYIFFDNAPRGWYTIICLILLIGGLQIFMIGVLGLYILKLYDNSIKRPIFIIDRIIKNERIK